MSGTRIPVVKTYKMYIQGAWRRSESGMVFPERTPEGEIVAQIAKASRKDLRDSVVAARSALAGWTKRSAFNRSQILYRIAEMLEDRTELFVDRLVKHCGQSMDQARLEVQTAVDRIFWYAGWSDKFDQVLGSVNPVAGPYLNITQHEAMGVVAIFSPLSSPLLGFVSSLMPALTAGNTLVAVSSGPGSHLALDFGEVIATSDVPSGVVNILTGPREGLLPIAAGHQDIDALALFEGSQEEGCEVQALGADSVKRVRLPKPPKDWTAPEGQGLYLIESFVEWKTAWHPTSL